jgi:hypothetical protein
MTEQQRVDAGNELDAASKAYDAYLKKTKTAAAPAGQLLTLDMGNLAKPSTAAPAPAPAPAASPTTFGEEVLETRRQEMADARATGQQDTDPRNLVDLVDAAIAVAKVEAAKPPPETLVQKASKVRLFANTRDWYAKRLAAITARKQQGRSRKTLRRGGANSALAPFVAAIKKKLSAISSDADEKPQVAFSRLVSAGGALDDAAGDKVATLLLPLANAFTRWRFGARNMALRYSPIAVADAETLYNDIQTPVQIQRIFAANDSNLYKIKFPPTGAAPSNEELAAAGAAAAVAVATDMTTLDVVKPAEPGQDDQEFLGQAEPGAVSAVQAPAPPPALDAAVVAPVQAAAAPAPVAAALPAAAPVADSAVVAAPALAPAAAAAAVVAAPVEAAPAAPLPAPVPAAPTPAAVEAAAAPLPAPVAPLPAAVEADAAQNMFGGECEVPLQGPNYAATKIRGDGWCFYKAVLAGSGKPGYTEAEENVSIEARKQSDDGAYALANQLRDLLVGPNLELFKKIYGSPRPTTIVDGSGSRRETLNADQFIARMVQEPIEVEGFLAPRVYAEGDALAPFVANLLHVRIAIYAGGQLSGKGCPDNEPNALVVSLDYVNGDHYNVFLPLPTPSVPAAEEPAEAEPAASESSRPSSAASESSSPSSAASESRRPSSATSLGSVGVPQLRDQDFAVRLGAAKAKFEQMRAATGKLEMTVDASKVVRKPTKRRNQTQRINPADIDNLYRELKASQLTRKAKTDNERNKRAQRRLTASVAPAPADDELAAIEADLKSAEDTVGQFKALVDELRAKDSGVLEVAEWIMTADMELELQLDYLSQVEQNLATVPGPVDLTRLRQVHAGLDLPRPPASLTKPPWRNGGRRKTPRRRQGRHKRPPRNSTFRRHRKH